MGKPQMNILIGGQAGQGLATIGELLSRALVRGGYHIVVTQSYMSRIRGGNNGFEVRVSTRPIHAPRRAVDMLVALDAETVEIGRRRLAPEGRVFVDVGVKVSGEKLIKAPYSEMADHEKFFNTAALGVIAAALGLEPGLVGRVLEHKFGDKDAEVVESNQQVLDQAFAWADKNIKDSPFKLEQADAGSDRLMLDGNQALALGAISAGVGFCSFYPMTPSTTVALTLAAHARELGLVVEQAEDEIAAVNMGIGAAFAGVPALVPTSGGGFALMGEGLSLAGMTETPIVVVVSQRPGPATGLPTRTEQGDLELALHSGHGEFPRAVFAPGGVDQCFHLARRAFEAAELAQTPAIILTDQFLADSLRAVERFPVEELGPVAPLVAEPPAHEEYRRYAETPSGVSPRLVPGGGRLVVADSDEHAPDGHLTEDLEVRVRMNRKRLNKLGVLLDRVIEPEYQGPEPPELLLVCWGSTRGAALEAAEELNAGGRRVAVMHFSQVWPLKPEQFLPRLQAAGRIVALESNATGQFAKLIRRETGFGIEERILRYDGLPITPEYVIEGL